MSGGYVPAVHSYPSLAGIKTGKAVRGDDIAKLAELMNFNFGRNGQLIAAYDPGASIAAGATHTFRFKVWPRYNAIQRLWLVRMTRAAGAEAGVLTALVKAPSGASGETVAVTRDYEHAQEFGFIEEVTQARTIQDATISIKNNATTLALGIEMIQSLELPRARLISNATEYGIDLESCRGGAPIMDGASLGRSYQALAQSVKAFESENIRPSLFHWAVDDNDPETTTSASYVSLFADGGSNCGGIFRGHKDLVASTTIDVPVYVRAKVSTTATGTLRITTSSGSSVAINFTSTSYGWVSGTLTIPADDFSDSRGLSGGSFCISEIEVKTTAGTASVSGISIGAG